MKLLKKGAVHIEPKTIRDMGNVARQGLLDSEFPARPPTTNIIGICDPSMA